MIRGRIYGKVKDYKGGFTNVKLKWKAIYILEEYLKNGNIYSLKEIEEYLEI